MSTGSNPDDAAASLLVELEGSFWDPQAPEHAVRGRLTWSGASATLALEDVLHPATGDELDPLQRIVRSGRDRAELIAGITVFGERLCLIDCFVHRMQGARVHHPQLWSVSQALLGIDTPPAQVHGLELRIPAMRSFYGEALFELDRAPAGAREKLSMVWQSSPEVTIALDGLRLVFDDDWSVSGPVFDLRLRATPRLRLLPTAPAPVDELDAAVARLVPLIEVCQAAPLEIAETRLLLDHDRQARRLQLLRPIVPTSAERSPWLALGNLAPIDVTVERWLAFAGANPNAVAMLSDYLRSHATAPSADRLLQLVRFIEEYYRSLITSNRLQPKRTLQARLLQLARRHAATVGAALGPKAASFAQRAADTRHYYTHYDQRLAGKAATEMELVILTDRMWALIRACLLDELGLDMPRAGELLALDPRLGWLAQQP